MPLPEKPPALAGGVITDNRVFVAGASGAIGIRLVPLLVDAGYDVYGTTRTAAKVAAIEAAGANPVVVDAFDAAALSRAVVAVHPETVIQQLTDLPDNFQSLDPSRRAEALRRNARMRKEGTANLVAAAREAGAQRFIAQSIAWVYAPGPEPHSENDPLDLHAEGTRAVTVGGVIELERLVLNSPPLLGIVLRYGQLYGPDTGADQPGGVAPLHVDAAASAALLAARHAYAGIFNYAEANAYVSCDKARQQLGWDPDFRLNPARPPTRNVRQ